MKTLVCSLLTAVFLFCGSAAQGAYLKAVPQEIIQPDGSRLICYATGDEYYHWLHDADNFTIIVHPETGYYVYASLSGDELVPTTCIAGKAQPVSCGLVPGINISESVYQERFQSRFKDPLLKSGAQYQNTGTYNNLVVFIRFQNQNEYTEPLDPYAEAFNGSGTGVVSMHEYYREVSKNQLSITSTFYPAPQGSTIVSYQDAHIRRYYQPFNASTNPDGYRTDSEYINREMTLLKNAIESISAEVEASGIDYDHDDDGRIDNVCFIVQGPTDGWSDLLWPHRWVLYAYDVRIGGARVYDFNFQLSEALGVSVLCHEMFHSLGAPDLYRYVNTDITPVGPWDLMSHNSTPPQHMGAYMKMKYGQWFDQIPEITADGTYYLRPLASDPFAAYRIASPNSSQEFFVVEYRRAVGPFESGLSGTGLIIYRVNPALDGNADGPPDEVYVYRLNGTTRSNGSINSATFSSNVGRTEFSDNTNPSCFLSNGAQGGIKISNISAAGESISFRFGTGVALEPPQNLSVTLSGSVANLHWESPLNEEATLSGYRVYRSQSAVADVSSGTLSYADQELQPGDYDYFVTALYSSPSGESAPSNIVSITVSQEPQPDLLVVNQDVQPRNVEAEQEVQLICRVVNGGNADAGNSRMRVYLSKDQVFSSNDRQLAAVEVGALPSEAGQDISITATIPEGQESGGWYVLFLADADGDVNESIEVNNSATVTIIVGNPVFNPPKNLNATTNLNTIFLSWDAPDESVATLNGYRIFRDGAAIVRIDDPEVRSYADNGLDPGEYTYYVTAIYGFPEGESPGSVEVSVTITYQSLPDLTISDFVVSPTDVAPGGSIDISCQVRNTGSLASAESEMRLYLSIDQQLDDSDEMIAYGRVAALEPGSSMTVTGDYIQLPSGVAPGNWYVLIKADASEEVMESNEGNNTAYRSIVINGNIADLQITFITLFPSLLTPQSNVRITFNVYNSGAVAASSYSTSFYLSVDEHLDDSDIQLCSLNSRLLGSKSNALLNTGFAMPQGIPAGAYYLIGWVDSGELVSESNEVNNFYVQAINVAGTASTGLVDQMGGLSVYPNPSSGLIKLDFEGVPGHKSLIWVYDRMGRTVLYREVPASVENQLVEDISGWSPGIYLIRLQQGANIRSTRLIVQ